MATTTRTVTSPSLLDYWEDFDLSLRAQRKSPKTRRNYEDAVKQLGDFLKGVGHPCAVETVKREHVEAFLVYLEHEKGVSASTVATRYRGLQQFFRYAEDDGEIDRSPMAKMSPPKVPEKVRRIVTEDELRLLFKTCAGRSFEDRRDLAMMRLLLDGGVRMAELVGMRVEDVDLAKGDVLVTGKGERQRYASFESKTALALRKYLRTRDEHAFASSPAVWLGIRGPLTDYGVRQILKRRAEQAGIGHLHAHLFRHAFAHYFLQSGGRESDLMRLAGWRTPEMARRYGAAAADQRARESHALHSPGERI